MTESLSTSPLDLLQPAATRVKDPLSGRSIWLAEVVQNPTVDESGLKFDLVFSEEHTPAQRRTIEKDLECRLRDLGVTCGIMALPKVQPASHKTPVRGTEGGGMAPHGGAIEKKRLRGVKHVIVVASGKGGVGKSTISTNLAVGLKKLGHSVGLLDADVYGPSLPIMMGAKGRPMAGDNKTILPIEAHGVKCISLGFFVDPKEAIIWRGPMVMGAIRQLLQETDWSGVDYLVVDLPPGTGDVQLTLIQAVEIAGAVIVTTPQPVALADAVRGISMFERLDVPLLGLVENMAYYELPDGSRDYVFGKGGGIEVAAEHNTRVLCQVPLLSTLRECGDNGTPAVLFESHTADVLLDVAGQVAEMLPVDAQ